MDTVNDVIITQLQRIQFMFGTNTPLHSLLIKPVQRIAKYPLLMKVVGSLIKSSGGGEEGGMCPQ